MAKEIERKFLVLDNSYKENAQKVYMCQAYLHIDEKKVVRIRITDTDAWITIKSNVNGIIRNEYEYTIPLNDAKEMLSTLCNGSCIEKYRYLKSFGGKLWEIDEFMGDNQGLVVAEIELTSEDEFFEKPIWIGKEVSQDTRYFNSCLTINPYKKWVEEK
ncbi:MAG: CYTH domain-containing protein [Bacteroidales bacterium]